MAETVRDVLIRFRVEGPRSSGGGSPAVGGLAIGGSSASAASVNRGGVSGDGDLPRILEDLTDSIKSLTLAIRIQGVGQLIGAAGGANAIGGGAVGAGLGRLGAGAGALGARALAVGTAAAPYALGAAAVLGGGYLAYSGARSLAQVSGVGQGIFDPGTDDPIIGGIRRFGALGGVPGQVGGVPERFREYQRRIANEAGNAAANVFGEDSAVFGLANRLYGITAGPGFEEQGLGDPSIGLRNQARQRQFALGRRRSALAISGELIGRTGQQFDAIQGLGTLEGGIDASDRRLDILRGNLGRTQAMLRGVSGIGGFEGTAGEESNFLKQVQTDLLAVGTELVNKERQKLELARQQVEILKGPAMTSFLRPGLLRHFGPIKEKVESGADLSRRELFMLQGPLSGLVTPEMAKMVSDQILTQQRENPAFTGVFGREVKSVTDVTDARGIDATTKAIEGYMKDASTSFGTGLTELTKVRELLGEIKDRLAVVQEEGANIGALEIGDGGAANRDAARR